MFWIMSRVSIISTDLHNQVLEDVAKLQKRIFIPKFLTRDIEAVTNNILLAADQICESGKEDLIDTDEKKGR